MRLIAKLLWLLIHQQNNALPLNLMSDSSSVTWILNLVIFDFIFNYFNFLFTVWFQLTTTYTGNSGHCKIFFANLFNVMKNSPGWHLFLFVYVSLNYIFLMNPSSDFLDCNKTYSIKIEFNFITWSMVYLYFVYKIAFIRLTGQMLIKIEEYWNN